MSDPLKNISNAISIVQLTQMIVSLASALRLALVNGQQEVTPDQLAASFMANDEALAALDAAIKKAQAEGR